MVHEAHRVSIATRSRGVQGRKQSFREYAVHESTMQVAWPHPRGAIPRNCPVHGAHCASIAAGSRGVHARVLGIPRTILMSSTPSQRKWMIGYAKTWLCLRESSGAHRVSIAARSRGVHSSHPGCLLAALQGHLCCHIPPAHHARPCPVCHASSLGRSSCGSLCARHRSL